MKACKFCAAELVRRPGEQGKDFTRRKTCSETCAAMCKGVKRRVSNDPRLDPGEFLIDWACSDVTACGCRTKVHDVTGLDCTELGRLGNVDRCLNCGMRWKARSYRDETLVIVREAA